MLVNAITYEELFTNFKVLAEGLELYLLAGYAEMKSERFFSSSFIKF